MQFINLPFTVKYIMIKREMKHRIVSIFCLACFSILISCNQDKKLQNEKVVSTISVYSDYYNDKKMMDSLFNLVKTKGDTLAYFNLYQIYSLSGHKEEVLFTSLLMANKYKYKQAYFHVYKNLNTLERIIQSNSKDSVLQSRFLDNETTEFQYNYLVKASENGHIKAAEILNRK